ncbi:hypothetical protein L0152_19895, partial [bacterium]|nr:hypothetical protein [bacterium]
MNSSEMIPEVELLQRAREGDPKAGELLFVRYLKESKAIDGLLRRSLANKEDREDILQETYISL